MTAAKRALSLAGLTLATLFALSCGSDSSVKITYKIVGTGTSGLKVSYTNAKGSQTNVTPKGLPWSSSITVEKTSFDGRLTAVCDRTKTTSATCNITSAEILVDGKSKGTQKPTVVLTTQSIALEVSCRGLDNSSAGTCAVVVK